MVLPGMERTSIAVPSDDATSPWKKWNDGIAVEIIRSVDENSDALRHVHAGQLVIPPVDERRTVSFPLMQPLPSTCRLDAVSSHEAESSHEAASHEATIHLTKRRRIVTSLRDRCFKVQGISGRNGRLIPATEYVLAILPHEMRAVDFFDTATVFPMAGTTANGEDAFAFAYGGAATAHQNDVSAQGDGTVGDTLGDTLARHRACYARLRATHAASQELHRLRTAHTEAVRQLRDDDKAQARATLNKLRHDDERTYDTELLAMQRLLRHTQQGMRHDLHTLDNELQRQLTSRNGDCPPHPHPPPMLRRGQPIAADMEVGAVAPPPVTHSWSSPLLQ